MREKPIKQIQLALLLITFKRFMYAIRQVTFAFLRFSPLVVFVLCLARYSVLLIRSFDHIGHYGTAIKLVAVLGISAWQYAVGRAAGDEASNRKIHISGLEYYDSLCLAAIALQVVSLLWPEFISITDAVPPFGFFGFTNIGNLSAVLWGASLFKAVLAAKALVSVEEGKQATFSDYFPTLLLLIIPFIGVWFIQSRMEMMRRAA